VVEHFGGFTRRLHSFTRPIGKSECRGDTFAETFLNHCIMNKCTCIALVGAFLLVLTTGFSQTAFNNCTAAFLDNKLVVDQYSPEGKCTLSLNATGELTVATIDGSETGVFSVDKIRFKVALKDKNTGTLTMFTDENYKRLDVQKVLARCKKGDSIILITLDDTYALPHNEIVVQ
jgi:hypothetical protein